MIATVAHFLAAGLRAGEPVLVYATAPHRDAFAAQLAAQGIDVARARDDGQLAMYDAGDTLAKFMTGDRPVRERFVEVIGDEVASCQRGREHGRVRVFGEMVDLLWRDDKRAAAIELETFWNELASDHAFTLLCAYVMGNFYGASLAGEFHDVCASHTHVIPTESYSSLDADGRSRHVSSLQQRARALEAEVAHRKELEASLRDALAREKAAREEAERHVRFSEMFAGMLGHDLRNPLGTIVMGATYLARLNLGDKPSRTANRIVAAAERMARMIDQLLDLTRIRAGGGLELARTRVDLAEICDRIRDELEASNPQCAIAFDARGNTSGVWDYDRLLQVFSNLVGNAITHGSATCRVTIHADGAEPSQVIAQVHNDGAIPPEVMPTLFEPFRGSTRRHKTNGLGLGLFITKQIVEAHGGTISVVSNDVQGTTVKLQLPRFPDRHDGSTLSL